MEALSPALPLAAEEGRFRAYRAAKASANAQLGKVAIGISPGASQEHIRAMN